MLAEEVAETAAAADLVSQIEGAIVTGKRAERSEFELVRPLRGQGDRGERRECEDSACLHDVTSCDRSGCVVR